MRRTILALVLAIGALVLAAPAAQAEPKPKDKLYLGFGGNYSFGNGAVGKHSAVGALPGIQPNQGFGDVFGNGFGFSGYIGGSLMDNLSGQLVYTGEFYSSKALDLDVHWFMAEAKANARLGRYDPYGTSEQVPARSAFADFMRYSPGLMFRLPGFLLF